MIKYKARASGVGNIMSDSKKSITIKQLKEIDSLLAKKADKMLKGQDITLIQNAKLYELLVKKESPFELSDSAKSTVEGWYLKERFKKHREFNNKYTIKGLTVEDAGIALYGKVTGQKDLVKNEKHFNNAWVTGTPDVICEDTVVDIKCSWDLYTFPLFEEESKNKLYWWQLQTYMWLLDKNHAELAYCLVDTPDEILLSEHRKATFGMSEEESDAYYEHLVRNMTFGDIPENLRVKIFKFDRDEAAIESIKKRVGECRKHLAHKIKTLNL